MFIFSNLAVSVDGKIATTDRTFFPLGTPEVRDHMNVLRAQSNAVLIGAETFRVYKKPLLSSDTTHQPLNVILSSKLEGISPRWDFFTQQKIQRLLIVSHQASPLKVKPFLKSSEVVVLKKPSLKHSVAFQIIDILKQKGIKRLLIEGGGGVMWDFVKHNLINEFHITLTPKILGGHNAPTLVDGLGFVPKQIINLKLRQCRIEGNEIYLIYSNEK